MNTYTPQITLDDTADFVFDATRYEVLIDSKRGRGSFTDNKYGDEGNEGGLWFEGKVLIDMDGCSILPKQVIRGIRKMGFVVPYIFVA